jgi:hypothetical protein
MAALPASFSVCESTLVRRLVEAKDDPAKKRIRAWLMDLDDLQLSAVTRAHGDKLKMGPIGTIGTTGPMTAITIAGAHDHTANARPRGEAACQH